MVPNAGKTESEYLFLEFVENMKERINTNIENGYHGRREAAHIGKYHNQGGHMGKLYGAVQWVKDMPVLDGMPAFPSEAACLDYIKSLPETGGVSEWTIIKIYPVNKKNSPVTFGSVR